MSVGPDIGGQTNGLGETGEGPTGAFEQHLVGGCSAGGRFEEV